jgi:predicted glycosyltransferase involved in capsule biosynthesis
MDYNVIKKECFTILPNIDKAYISIIIPIQGRTEFKNTIKRNFKIAIDYLKEKHDIPASLTFVEHSNTQLWKPDEKEDWINYIHIPQGDSRFNKCLCHNIGALFSTNAYYYMFHDVDILVPKDLFSRLAWNILQGYDAVQSFNMQRLNYCNSELTQRVLSGQVGFDNLPSQNLSISVDNSGKSKAQGGSMFVENKMFYEVGGFDTHCTQYSVEDAIFFDKLKTVGNLGFADNPVVEMYHLHHEPPTWGRVTKQEDWDYYNHYMSLDEQQKKESIKKQSEYLKQFING